MIIKEHLIIFQLQSSHLYIPPLKVLISPTDPISNVCIYLATACNGNVNYLQLSKIYTKELAKHPCYFVSMFCAHHSTKIYLPVKIVDENYFCSPFRLHKN